MDLELSTVARIFLQGRRSSSRKLWASVNLSKPLGRVWDGFFAAPALVWLRRIKTWRVGAFLYLVGIALVGAITIGIFFGVGLYSLVHPTAETTAVPAVRHDAGAAPIRAMAETSASAGTSRGSTIVSPVGTAALAPEPAEPPAGKHAEPNRFAKASSETVSGAVNEASDAMTWIVADRAVQLWGIRRGPPSSAPLMSEFVDWVRAKGPVACHKQAHSNRYRCLTATGEDIAEAVLLGGVGRVAGGATLRYRKAEAQARQKGNGLWAKP